MRLIDADNVMDAVFNAIDIDEKQWNEIKQEVNEIPTIDPESLRPTAHIMRGTVQSTHDAGFCSNCKLCIDADYGTALAKSYSYCPHCGAKFGG